MAKPPTPLPHEKLLQQLSENLKIISPTQFQLGTMEVIDWQEAGFQKENAKSILDTLTAALQGYLYNVIYIKTWSPTDNAPYQPPQRSKPDWDFLNKLHQSISDLKEKEAGWNVLNPGDIYSGAPLQLKKHEWQRQEPSERLDIYTERDTQQPLANIKPRDPHLDEYHSFFYIYGFTLTDGAENQNKIRLYFHTTPKNAPHLITTLCNNLNQYKIPFILKTIAAPAKVDRNDSTILYIDKQYVRTTLFIIRGLPSEVLGSLAEQTPAFTLKLAPGVSIADDPINGESFGTQHTRIIAETMVSDWLVHKQTSSPDDIYSQFKKRYSLEGLDWNLLHLSPHNKSNYKDDWNHSIASRNPTHKALPSISSLESNPYLYTAYLIGKQLCRDALWQGSFCTWQGWSVVERGNTHVVNWQSFGGDLYRGTSGIALFLAHLYQYTQDDLIKTTVLGAFRQAFRTSKDLSPDLALGFYTGLPGIAYAAIEAGKLMEESSLMEQGIDLLRNLSGITLSPPMFDVVSGVSGTIPALLSVGVEHNIQLLRELAIDYGEWLIQQAHRQNDTLCWSGSGNKESAALCGYSHGASGVSLSLIHLYHATKSTDFLYAGMKGISYESQFFNTHTLNWDDLRLSDKAQRSSSLAWCHGAPGIGLARSRMIEILPNEPAIKNDLNAATRATAQQLSSYSQSLPLGNYSLCHGVFGNAELLLENKKNHDYTQLTHNLAQKGMEDFIDFGKPWKSGLPEFKPTPGLMLGDAGVGYFYLRMHDQVKTPSLLCLQTIKEKKVMNIIP